MELNITESEITKKKTKTAVNHERSEDPCLLLSMVDKHILEEIFVKLVYEYFYANGPKSEQIYKTYKILGKFRTCCKYIHKISQQKLFPLTLNGITQTLPYNIYLIIMANMLAVQEDEYYTKKDINAILYEACTYGQYPSITTLIRYKPDLNCVQGSLNYTVLITATNNHFMKTLKKLLKEKAVNINHVDTGSHCTALMLACTDGKTRIVEALLSRKDIDVNFQGKYRQTALDIAKGRGYSKIVTILKNHQNSLEEK